MRKVKILFTDIHEPEYHDKNQFREGFEWGKRVVIDLCIDVDLDEMFNLYIDQPEARVRNGRVVKFSEFAIEYLEEEQKWILYCQTYLVCILHRPEKNKPLHQ